MKDAGEGADLTPSESTDGLKTALFWRKEMTTRKHYQNSVTGTKSSMKIAFQKIKQVSRQSVRN